jgi:hypothetical protein
METALSESPRLCWERDDGLGEVLMSSAFSIQVDISKHNRKVLGTWDGRQGLTPSIVSLG